MEFIQYDQYITGEKFKKSFMQAGIYSDIDFVLDNIKTDACYIITHNGDNPVTKEKVVRYRNLKRWFGQNVLTDDNRVIPLPIGLENDYIAGQPYRKLTLYEKSKIHKFPNRLIYCNFNLKTNIEQRGKCYQYFYDKDWCTTRVHGTVEYSRYCDEILDHDFVVCPVGNGLDCHRNWEVLYLRRFPVMKRSHSLEKLYEDLPVVFVDDWSEVNEKFLLKEKNKLASRKFNFKKMEYSYWEEIIKNEQHL